MDNAGRSSPVTTSSSSARDLEPIAANSIAQRYRARPAGRAALVATVIVTCGLWLSAGCGSAEDGSGDTATTTADGETTPAGGQPEGTDDLHPDVIGARAEPGANGTWTVHATLSSPYDTPERYADAWRVIGPDGTVYGVRELAHDHASEQPFTRSLSGVEIPDGVTEVTIEGRDQVSGWGGQTFVLVLER